MKHLYNATFLQGLIQIKYLSMEEKYQDLETQLKKLQDTTIETMWNNDLDKLVTSNKQYNIKLQKVADFKVGFP